MNFLSYRILCLIRFIEHFSNIGISQEKYNKNFFSKLKNKLTKKIYSQNFSNLEPYFAKDEDEFIYKARECSMPIILKGGAKNWPCSMKWNNKYFEENCAKTVVYNINDSITEENAVNDKTTLLEVLKNFGNGNSYARFLPIINTFPEILKDFDMKFCKNVIDKRNIGIKLWGEKKKGVALRSHFFMGESGTKTNTHCELTNNLFINVKGTKRWVISPPEYIFAYKSPVTKNPGVFGSEFSHNKKNLSYETASKLPKYEIDLEAGDILYLPPFYWHEVENLTDNISLGLRWYNFKDAMKSSKTLNILSLLATRPTMKFAIKNATEYGAVHGKK